MNYCWKCEKGQEEVWLDYDMCSYCRSCYFQDQRELEDIDRGVPNIPKFDSPPKYELK